MITCMLTCHRCGLEKVPYRVRDRGHDEDVVAFVTECRRIAQDIHDLRSPVCPARILDLYVPMSKDRVGEHALEPERGDK